MDGTKTLFKKIKGKDRTSFDVLSENYGWKLYSHIRNHTKDRAEADRIFSKTFDCFYRSLESYDGDDPIEALLFACADQASSDELVSQKNQEEQMGQWAIGHEAGFTLPTVHVEGVSQKKESFFAKFFYGVCILLLIIGILAALWIMLYMLMSMNIIPDIDLGYTWFNTHIMDLF